MSYTSSIIIDNKRKDTLHDGLLQLSIELLSLDGQIAVVRTDPLPGFQDLVATLLKKTSHCNWKQVLCCKIQELQEENLCDDPMPGHIFFLL